MNRPIEGNDSWVVRGITIALAVLFVALVAAVLTSCRTNGPYISIRTDGPVTITVTGQDATQDASKPISTDATIPLTP